MVGFNKERFLVIFYKEGCSKAVCKIDYMADLIFFTVFFRCVLSFIMGNVLRMKWLNVYAEIGFLKKYRHHLDEEEITALRREMKFYKRMSILLFWTPVIIFILFGFYNGFH